jgi:alkylation response protein AidB-like acyl-CoA dehydrogenase
MNIFTAEHEELRRTVRSLLERHSPESEVRRVMATEDGHEPAMWSRLAETGLLGLAVPEEYGGAGYGWVEVGVVIEEFGRALLCAPFFSTAVLAVAVLLSCGDEAACKEYMPALAAGGRTATLAITEDSGRWGLDGIEFRAARTDGAWTLNGHKNYVLDGHTANLILVAARTERGVSVFAVDGNAPGLTREQLLTLDLTRRQARLQFRDVPARLVGEEGRGSAQLERTLDLAAVGLAAEQVGGATRSLEMAVEYAKVRHQFGRPIGSFQAVKHMCADMLVDVEFARSAAYHALWAADHSPDELPVAANLAKICCSDAFVAVAGQNLQVHGGIGFTWEHPAHLYLKRAKTDQLLLGDATYHRNRLARRIGI